MDTSWIDLRRINPRAYVEGVRMFLNFAYMNKNQDKFIRCPCIKCANRYYHGRDTVNEHLLLDGFLTSYKKWTRHGEGNIGNTVNVSDAMIVDHNTGDDVQVESSLGANMLEMVREGVGIPEVEGNMVDNEEPELDIIVGFDEDSAKFLKLLKDAETELFPNCRGPAKPLKQWGTDKRLILEWNEFHQPVGPNASLLAGQLGSFARDGDLLPLTITSWSGMDQFVLDNIWEDILSNTNAPPEYKTICMKSLNEKWRVWKHRVKHDYYLVHQTDEERRSNPPPRLDPEQWETLIRFWGKESSKKIAETNSECRGCPVAVSRTGRTSHANKRHEMKQKNEPINRPSVWRTTRKKKDGTFDEKDGAKEIEEQLATKLSTLAPENSQDPTMLDQVFVDVIGGDGHGRVRTIGIVAAPPSSKSRTSSSQASQSNFEASIRAEYEERFTDLERKLQQQISDQQRQIAELMAAMRNQNVTSPRVHSTIPTLASSVSESRDPTFLPTSHQHDDIPGA